MITARPQKFKQHTDTDQFSREVLHPECAFPLTYKLDRPFNTSRDSGGATDSEGGDNISNAKAPGDGLRSFFTCNRRRSLNNDLISLSNQAERKIAPPFGSSTWRQSAPQSPAAAPVLTEELGS